MRVTPISAINGSVNTDSPAVCPGALIAESTPPAATIPAHGAHRAKAPARAIVPLTQELFDRVRSKVDASTAGQPWKPFKVSTLEMYWPSHRPNDPDLFDWGQLDDLGDLQEP